MKIELFRTFLCPRCLYVTRILTELTKRFPDLELEIVEVTTGITRARQAGIRMLPTIRIGGELLSGFFLRRSEILTFIEQQRSGRVAQLKKTASLS